MLNDYSTFINTVKEGMEERGYTVKVQEVNKGNNVKLQGITFYSDTSNIAPILYLENFFQMFLKGTPMTSILTRIEEIFTEQAYISFNTDIITDLNAIKGSIFPCLVRKTDNSLLNEDVVSSTWKDLAVVFRIILQHGDYENATILIRESLLQMWRLTENELLDIAMENLKNSQMEFCSLIEKLSKLLSCQGMAGPDTKGVCTPIYIATNLSNNFGASVIMDGEKLKQIAQIIKDDFYIIPSSVHEVLCVPMHEILGEDILEQTLMDANLFKVEPEEVLEWHIYRYQADTEEVTCIHKDIYKI